MTTHTTPSTTHLRRAAALGLCAFALAGAAACGTPPTDQPGTAATTSPGDPTDASTTTVAPPAAGVARESAAPDSSAPAATSSPRLARPAGHRDDLIAVAGARMHLHCDGAGAATVVLIAGFESSSDSWSAVTPALTERTRVCAYDRPGLGASEPATTTTGTFTAQAVDLRALLTAAGEPGPYVVVGHSFGGLAAVEFAEQYSADVAALVLVDTSPIDWPTSLCRIADDGSGAAAFIRGMCAGWTDPSANAEHLDVFAAFDDSSAPPALGSLPVAVITAVDRELPPDISDTERARLTDAWNAGQRRWTRLSADTRLTAVPDTGHYVQLDQPAVVIDEIGRLLPHPQI